MHKTLYLTLKKKWFDMVASGDKVEEYREIKPYWTQRFCKMTLREFCFCDLCKKRCFNTTGTSSKFNRVVFRNGYSRYSPTITVECKGISIGIGKPEWGAPDYPVFIIKLGKIIQFKNK